MLYDGNEIQKSRKSKILSIYGNDEIEKGGEGSKGGKVIGHTSSGKPIYDTASHEAHANFTKKDHLEAAGRHERDNQRLVNEKDKSKIESKSKHHTTQAAEHYKAAGKGEKEKVEKSQDDNLNKDFEKLGL